MFSNHTKKHLFGKYENTKFLNGMAIFKLMPFETPIAHKIMSPLEDAIKHLTYIIKENYALASFLCALCVRTSACGRRQKASAPHPSLYAMGHVRRRTCAVLRELNTHVSLADVCD